MTGTGAERASEVVVDPTSADRVPSARLAKDDEIASLVVDELDDCLHGPRL